MNDGSCMSAHSAHSAPPMRAFQGLLLAKNRRMKRRSSSGTAPKTPIDPLRDLGVEDDDDYDDDDDNTCHSELTEDDTRTLDAESRGLFENLQRNWSSGDQGFLEQACFAAFCSVFYDSGSPLPLPHRVVVTGFWGHVVLPSLVGENQMPQLVAQDIWDVLRTKLRYITEDGRNTVSLAHAVYKDFGQRLVDNANTVLWKHEFADYLQRSLVGDLDQPHFIQLYASQAVVPYWLSLGKVTHAASLLHQPAFTAKQWKLLSKQENPLQITTRHVKLVELYLSELPPSSSKWQEGLGLYQGWHTLLQQEMQIHLENPVDSSSDRSQGSGGSSNRSWGSASSKRRRKKSSRRKKTVDPMQLLILGRSLFVLGASLDAILTELPGSDPAMSVLWKRQAEYLSESLQVFAQLEDGSEEIRRVQYLLSAATWLSLSASCATMEECDVDEYVDLDNLASLFDLTEKAKGETDELHCINVAKVLLERATPSKRNKTLQLAFLSLKAELHDIWGRWLYDKQRFERARVPLQEAINLRRQVLALLKDKHSNSHTLFWWGSAPATDDEDAIESLCHQLCLHVPDSERQVQDTEISLARSLEYTALALHACDLSLEAMSWLQEALILKTSHLGKMSLEVARLNAAMAIVNEDLLQWEAGLSKYRECLRVRMHLLTQKDPDQWFTTEYDLFHSILETLTSMGSAYRMLGDHDNAVGCYWKIATMSKKEWEGLSRSNAKVKFWGFEGHRKMASDLRPLPLPTIVLDEERYSKSALEISPPQLSPVPTRNDKNKNENDILQQAAQAYQTILSLFEDKMSKVSHNSSNNLAASIDTEDVPLLLAASYRLGLIHVHFGDFRSAISSLEHALHSLWVLDPSTSDSSSESEDDGNRRFSREALRRQSVLRSIFGNEMETVDDDGVYHALGICRAACGEHDQAVRFHLTALRSARRMYGVDSTRAGEILYDSATSYWYLKDYDKAQEFWSACLRIELMKGSDDSLCYSEDERDGVFAFDRIDDMKTVEHAKLLFNIGASLCVLGRYTDIRTQESLEKAKSIFTDQLSGKKNVEIAGCLFYLATVELQRGGSSNILRFKNASQLLNRASSIYRSLGYLPPGSDSGFAKDKSSRLNVPLQAHIKYLEASVSEALGKLHLAMDTYNVALHVYRRLADKRWAIYVASVLHATGKLHVKMYHEYVALPIFQEALTLRRGCLGRDHEAVGDTLYHMAEIYTKMDNDSLAMDMYHEALRIQVLAEGSDGPNVALSLQMIASLYIKQGNFEAGLGKLKASLRIRKNRVALIDRASQVVSFWSGDLADDFLALSKEETKREDGAFVHKTLQGDLVKEEVGLAVVLHCMGNIHVKLDEYKDAKDCFEQSLRVRRNHSADDGMSPGGSMQLFVSDTLHNLGCLYELQEDYDNALRYFATALKLKHKLVNESKEPDSSEPDLQALIIYNGKGSLDGRYLSSKGSISYAMTLHRLGSVHYRLGNNSISLACLDAALRIQKHYLGDNHFTVAATLVDMASVLRRTEDKAEAARECYKAAYEIRKLRDRSNADVGHVLFHIGQLYDVDKEYSQATSYYYRSIQAYGHRYVNDLSRRVCEAALLRGNNGADSTANSDMLSTGGLPVRSIEETDDLIRSHFATVASAMRDVSKKRMASSAENGILMGLDVDAPDCWISLELYLLSLFELVQFVSSQCTKEAKIQMQHAFQQLEQAGVDGKRTNPEAITFQMLYLIQE